MKTLLMVIAAVTCVGCLHARQVETGETGAEQEQEGEQKEEAKKDEGEPKKQAPAKASQGQKSTKPLSSAEARPPVEEGRPELSVSPQGLMLPEGPRLIQQALVKRGYLPGAHQTGELDKETSAAIRKFQGDEELAKTGAPDRETVRRLGVTIEKVFRSSNHPNPNS